MSGGSNGSSAGVRVIAAMVATAAGIYGAFFAWGVLQERIATKPYTVDGKEAHFRFPFVIGVVGGLSSFAVALVVVVVRKLLGWGPEAHDPNAAISVARHYPYRQIASIGLGLAFGSPFGYAAMRHSSYPMVLTLKMCKMVPIVIVGALWHRAHYSSYKYLAMVAITGGVLGFSLLGDEGSKKNSASDALGAVLCFINLFFDGYVNSTQDSVLKKWKDPFRLMCTANLFSALIGLTALFTFEYLPAALHNDVINNELFHAMHFIAKEPAVLVDLAKMGALGGVGQLFIFQGLSMFGSLTVVAITITRKVGSVFISILMHGHIVTTEQWIALSAVIVGVVLDTMDNIRLKKLSEKREHHKEHHKTK